MALFERGQTVYRMDISERRKERQLVLEPYASPVEVTLRAWVEVEKLHFFYIVNDADKKPKGRPQARSERCEVEGSRRIIAVDGLACTLVRALARDELVGQSATDAVYALFWRYFVDDDEGLNYLYRYASQRQGDFYARARMQMLGESGASKAIYEAVIYEPVTSEQAARYKAITPLVGLRACQRAIADADFRDAIQAIVIAGEPKSVRHQRVLELIHTHFILKGPE